MNAPKEIWKPVPGRGAEASSEGRISAHGVVLESKQGRHGLSVILDGKLCTVARLVARAFHGQPVHENSLYRVRRIDGDENNCRPENLVWESIRPAKKSRKLPTGITISKPTPEVKKTRRPCLRCGAPFMSAGAGNRLCDGCRIAVSQISNMAI